MLFALALCVGTFSTTALAKSVEYDNSNVYVNVREIFNGSQYDVGQFAFNPNDDTVENTTLFTETDVYLDSYDARYYFYLQRNNQTMLFPATGDVSVYIENVAFGSLFSSPSGASWSTTVMHNFYATVYYTDNSTESIPITKTLDSNGWYDIKIEFTPQKDVQYILMSTVIKYTNLVDFKNFLNSCISAGDEYFNISFFLGELDNRTFNITIEQDSKEAGLLKNIGDKISGLWESIKELPTKIWSIFQEGLQKLFLPSDGFFEGLMDRLTSRVKEQGGIFTQVAELLNGKWDIIKQADETDSIDLPEATINFGDTPFTFGGYTVKIVPEGFEWLATVCKSVTGIICTVAFVNGMRKKYEEFMGVEK